ncbi:MAG: hypothetical protein MUF51_03465 [Vicinamibacteria bacterium]|jgi:hypothetical protein|nr:hypothetical protein [Vicinamibacteria bacterium]
MRTTIFSFCLATSVVLPVALQAQSLGEVAAKEKERRKGQTAKVITEDDLRRAGNKGTFTAVEAEAAPSASPTPSPAAGDASKKGDKKEKTDDEIRAEKQAEWRKKTDETSQEVSRLTEEVNRLEGLTNSANVNRLTPQFGDLLKKLEEAKAALATAKATASRLDDERRHSGYR